MTLSDWLDGVPPQEGIYEIRVPEHDYGRNEAIYYARYKDGKWGPGRVSFYEVEKEFVPYPNNNHLSNPRKWRVRLMNKFALAHDKEYLLLWGGTDISSKLYGEEPLPTTDKPDKIRDERELAQIDYYIRHKLPIIGVCRGAQLLCVANGGKLLQHVPEHRNNNHAVFILDTEEDIESVAADHHQVMLPAGNYTILGEAHDGYPEVVYWPDTKCLAVQPHPEWMNKDHPFNIWLDSLIYNLFGLKNVF